MKSTINTPLKCINSLFLSLVILKSHLFAQQLRETIGLSDYREGRVPASANYTSRASKYKDTHIKYRLGLNASAPTLTDLGLRRAARRVEAS